MTLPILVNILLTLLIATLSAVWWLRRGRGGLNWVISAVPLAFALSYGSSFLFRVPDYVAGCDGACPGWWGFPVATHLSDGVGAPDFSPAGFAANAAVYFAALLLFSALIALLAAALHWSQRRRRWRISFLALAILLPLALSPTLIPPPQPDLTGPEQRLALNAERAWRWQLQIRRTFDRRLALDDVRHHPDGERHRACFRVYTWFYLPLDRVYIDLEPAGVRSTGGGVIPLTASCWVQP